jgi:S-adenosylmethionine decarboxylase
MDCFEHFIRDGNEIYVGKHLIADMWGITNHSNGTLIKDSFITACLDSGATVLFSHQHIFGEDCGTTGVIVLAESHLSWHHYDEVNMISIDIFMCGKADPRKALPRIIEFWKPSHTDIRIIKRGIVEKYKLPNELTHILN